MEHGYYWLHMEYQATEVVEIDGESITERKSAPM